MLSRRVPAFIALGVVTFGSLAVTSGYAWYLRSAFYLRSCERALSRNLGLPAEIDRIVPRSWSSQEFQGVHVWLPQRRGEAAYVERALVRSLDTDDGSDVFELTLSGGRCEISTRTWLRDDYRFMLESGLRPGFDPNGPRRVVFSGMDLHFQRDQFELRLDNASGAVSFENPHRGAGAATCYDFNGHHTQRPVVLNAEFSPLATKIQLDEVRLTVPKLPLAVIHVEALAGVPLESGSFEGHVVYREADGHRQLALRGRATDVRLAEVTAPFLPKPWRGEAPELEVEDLQVRDGRPQRLRFRGMITGVRLDDVLAPWGSEGVGGATELRVRAAELSDAGIDELIAAGKCTDIELLPLTTALHRGRMTGRAEAVINDLTIEQNHVKSFDGMARVAPRDDGTLNWIERPLLSQVVQQALGFGLPSFLPERFAFVQLGARFQVVDEELYLFGTHGDRDSVILTVRIAGHDFGIVREPKFPIDLRPWLDNVRQQADQAVRARLESLTPREAWEKLRPTTVPGAGGGAE